jgi:putative transposase
MKIFEAKTTHHLHPTYGKKSNIERTIQYIKDRTECFVDDYFLCAENIKNNKSKLIHATNWFNLFVNH